MTDRINIAGQIVDVVRGRIYPGALTIEGEKITALKELPHAPAEFIIPGLIDSHIHIESSLLTPGEFARLAVLHGVTAVLADPHEIANVLGIAGIRYMIASGKTVPFKFFFGAPPSVPATDFESSGATIGCAELESLLTEEKLLFISEMMNFPGVIKGQASEMAKLALAKRYRRPVDGHAPGLRGEDLSRYIAAGISTDHECLSRAEVVEKIKKGMKVMLRQGSAATLTDEMLSLIEDYPEDLMFCSDDLHPDDLLRGGLNRICQRALARGCRPLSVIKAATLNPARHYGLDAGLLQVGDDADLVVLADLASFRVRQTYIKGRLVAKDGETLIASAPLPAVNNFCPARLAPADFALPARGRRVNVIEARGGVLFTERSLQPAPTRAGFVISSPGDDILKIAVINRYRPAPPALALVRGFGLQQGALASSVAHDSHNIVAVGVSDEDLARAVEAVRENRGGLVAVGADLLECLPLPVGGIMTDQDAFRTAAKYEAIDQAAKKLGATLPAPFMTLSFLALLVIPRLKLSDRGLFDGEKFCFVDLFLDK